MKHRILSGNAAVRLKSMLRRLSRQQYICMAVTVILTLAAWSMSGKTTVLSGAGELPRGEPGSGSAQYELEVSGIGKGSRYVDVEVSAREYTENEAEAVCEQLMEGLAAYICGSNPGLDEVHSDLELKRSIPGFDGIRINWYPEDTDLITDKGKVNNYELTEKKATVLNAVIRAGEYRYEYAVPVTVYPAEAVGTEELMHMLKAAVNDADKEQIRSSSLVLPSEVAGSHIEYSEPADRGWVKLPMLGILAVILLGLKPEQDRRRLARKRERELVLDYSDIVSKLAIYIGAGLTVTNAWIKTADNYAGSVKVKKTDRRAAYDEMLRTAGELKQGVPVSRAFAEFAERCSPNCYLRLISLLEQNGKTGDARLREALLGEARAAFEQRKNAARQLGEEAGTKLMLPLILSLITVMITVAMPAMMTFL